MGINDYLFIFFNDTETTGIYTFPYTTLFRSPGIQTAARPLPRRYRHAVKGRGTRDRKSTRSELQSPCRTSYAVFCLNTNTGQARSNNKAVITTDHTNRGLRSIVIPVNLLLLNVLIQFTAHSLDYTPDN